MARRTRVSILVAVLIVLSQSSSSWAQTSEPDVPTDCAIQPVSMLSLLAMLNDVNQQSPYLPLPGLSSLPMAAAVPGPSVTTQDMDGITTTTRMLVGCANSMEVMRVIALLSQEFQMRLVMEIMEGEGMDAVAEQLPLLITATSENSGIQAIPIQSAWYAEGNDRMIMAILEPVAPDPSAPASFLVTFVFSVDQWLIHDVKLLTDSEAG